MGFLPQSGLFNFAWLDDRSSSQVRQTFSIIPLSCIVSYGFTLCSFTLKVSLFSRFFTSMAPCGNNLWITNGPDHLDLSFPGNNFNLELNNNTNCPSRSSFFWICRSCHVFVCSLYIFAFSYTRFLNSSSSCSWIIRDFPALEMSQFRNLVAHNALCSSSSGRWHALP